MFVSALNPTTSRGGETTIFLFLCINVKPVCDYAFYLGWRSFIYASREYRVCEGNEVLWLLRGKLLKRLEPSTPS